MMQYKKKFRAILLAAGLGTRLRPLTNDKPKCLMEINGFPLIEYWLRNLEKCGCESVLINTHYLSEQVCSYLNKRMVSEMEINTIHENNLLGTGGTLKKNLDFFGDGTGLLIHADNYTNLNLKSLIQAHEMNENNTLMTMVTFKTENPKQCGIVEVNKYNVLINFQEKPLCPKSCLANGAIYVFDKRFLNEFKKLKNTSDFSKDVIFKFKGKIQTWFTNDILIDIGNPKSLDKAREKIIEL